MAGVFVTRGMTWGTPGVVISLDEAGKPVAGNMAIQVHFDVGPTWLQIALHHLEDSKVKQLERIEAWKGTNQKAKAAALEGEFETSMQAIMAAAIAIDAFYAVVQTKTKLPAHLITSWRAKKTARYAQICEVLRLAFSLRPQATRVLRQNLRAIYKLRDKAIHPTGKLEAPVLHPELQVGVEWRFSDFRFENAYLVVRETLNMLCELVTSGKPQNSGVLKYAEAVRPKLEKFKKAEVLAKHPHPVRPAQ